MRSRATKHSTRSDVVGRTRPIAQPHSGAAPCTLPEPQMMLEAGGVKKAAFLTRTILAANLVPEVTTLFLMSPELLKLRCYL
ncbi:hypothetical protein AV530_001699 [Patagioenas fasciata monilis]|uniref:Uncharacterized protein n=1 Tax=Patagioenas fasciata monilis TaxID=372326 RepID=A0A1V4KM20_PATFA|nr:hypothetical protein AV530_001699 [Patagioenas fasciata monilis]